MKSKGALKAISVLKECGLDDLLNFELELFIHGRGAILNEAPLSHADGRITFGKLYSLITIDSNIEHEGRRRFTIAHELGHHEMHKGRLISHPENSGTLSWFKNKIKESKFGTQEGEANDFASELLMPTNRFIEEANSKPFSPELLRELASTFKTSITSTAFRYLEIGNHPICLFFSVDNSLVYWKKSEDFRHYIGDKTGFPPPGGSVATEFFNAGKIYRTEESKQEINKSTWFELNKWEQDSQFDFYEYCIIAPKYGTVLSVVWDES